MGLWIEELEAELDMEVLVHKVAYGMLELFLQSEQDFV